MFYGNVENDLWAMGLADLTATVIVFVFSFAYSNSSIYDPYWSVYPIFISSYWIILIGDIGNMYRNCLVFALVLVWGIRLTLNWARGWHGMMHQDWRYVQLKSETGPFYWLVSFLGIHLFPTLLVFLSCIPLYFIFQISAPLGIVDVIVFLVTGGAILIEAIADNQLRCFKQSADNEGKVMDRGLWSYSRHPNYFGEILFWFGLFLFILNDYKPDRYWLVGGSVSIFLLFVFISIPMMEKRELKKQGYKQYKEKVSVLIPLPNRKK
ncbi:DUF1295 domain-containing protein [Echinicola shivajiensis]|uniref:DUF1295 domain-containing protein n=1 Tax=Echinicola shivajiensis TaxID=1035916 RepID=UPI001BFC577F|nr:DUF1295 domain-containing protein [Echinicola shivajiensis]